jgi:hypothetical protein
MSSYHCSQVDYYRCIVSIDGDWERTGTYSIICSLLDLGYVLDPVYPNPYMVREALGQCEPSCNRSYSEPYKVPSQVPLGMTQSHPSFFVSILPRVIARFHSLF